MKKLLFVMPTLGSGGAERSLVNLLNELPRNKYDIDLLLFKPRGIFISQLPKEVNLLKTPKDIIRLYGGIGGAGYILPVKLAGNFFSSLISKKPTVRRGFRWKYFYSPFIRKLNKKYDVAIAYISGEILYFVDEKVNADRKIVWVHNDYKSAFHPKKYDYPHLKNMDAIVSISNECVDILKEVFPEWSDKIYMLQNITSSDVLEKRAKEFVPEEYIKGEINILSIGRLHEQKGFDLAIKAAAILKSHNIKFKWFVLGTGELQTELNELIKENKVEDCFIMLGVRDNPYPYIANCSLFVQSSRYEGKSVVLDEAKILGKPIVATDYPTVSDQITDGKEGIIVCMDPQGIADGIERIITDENLRISILEHLRSNEYGNQKEVEKYISLIENKK